MELNEWEERAVVDWLDGIVDLDASWNQEKLAQYAEDFMFGFENRAVADAIVRLFERFPDRHEGDGFGYLNRVFVYSFPNDPGVIASFLRQPSAETTRLLVWWLSDGDVVVEGYDLRRLLHDLTASPDAPLVAKEIAAEWLEPDPDIHPGLIDPNLPVPTYEQIEAWNSGGVPSMLDVP